MKLTRSFTIALALGAAAGCGKGSDTTSSQAATATDDGGAPRSSYDATPPVQNLDGPASNRPSYGSAIPFTAGNDLAFIDVMVPGLGRGVIMANQVIDRGMRMDVKLFATRIRDEEQAAMNQLMAARTAVAASAEAPTAPRDPRAEEVMMQFMTQSGASLDDLYLRHILGHHGLELELVLRALPSLETATVRGLAEHMLESDADEIGEDQLLRHVH
jgi:uncharacterized protein (DUF305 family)